MDGICIILNVFKRRQALESQLRAVLGQTIKASEVIVWVNGGSAINVQIPNVAVKVIHSHENLGVWPRFSLPLYSDCSFFCVLDDDTLPGPRWLENCMAHFRARPGLYGTVGLRFRDPAYVPHVRFGWPNPNQQALRVDIVGHAWFFDKEMARAYWGQARIPSLQTAGEDIHFSFAIQKALGLSTFVPPHPKEDLSLWGANPVGSMKLGRDQDGVSMQPRAMEKFDKALQHYLKRGFRLYRDDLGWSPGVQSELSR